MITLWLVALLGAALNFLVKYLHKASSDNFNPKFWWKDNRIETLATLIVLTLLMLLLTNPETIVNYEDVFALLGVPEWVDLPGRLVLSAAIGYYSNQGLYWLLRKKKEEG